MSHSNTLIYPLAFSAVAAIGVFIYVGVTDTFETIEYERELGALKALGDKKDQLDKACEILLKHPESTQALETVTAHSVVPGWEDSLGALTPLFDPPPSKPRLDLTYYGDWRLIEARYRSYKKDWKRASQLFEERAQSTKLNGSDSRRFINALIHNKEAEKAWRYSLQMRARFPDLQQSLLAVMIESDSPFVRPLACDLALSCLEQKHPEKASQKLIETLIPKRPKLAASLLGTSFLSLQNKAMNQLRLKAHKQLTDQWRGQFQKVLKERGQLVPQDIEAHVGPWGQPYRFNRQVTQLIVQQSPSPNGPRLSVNVIPEAAKDEAKKAPRKKEQKEPAKKP